MLDKSSQLTLKIGLHDKATFETYFPGANDEAVACLNGFAREEGQTQQLYLWGAAGTGKSHLLQALCHRIAAFDNTAVYLPMARLHKPDPELLENIEQVKWVCIDDLDVVIGDATWEKALFSFINRLRESGHGLVFASRENPLSLAVKLPDLASRLTWGPVYHLVTLTDSQKQAALAHYAYQRGFKIPDEAGAYILKNYKRDMGSLMTMLDRIDSLSLRDQRRVTIPFIKGILQST